jgi:hypothetical protein
VDERWRRDERQHDNQPEWATRGAQQRGATRGKGATRVGRAGGREASERLTCSVPLFQHKGEEGRVRQNAGGTEYLCHLETKSWGGGG